MNWKEMNKQSFAELGMSTPGSSPDRAPITDPLKDGHHLEDHPEDRLMLDSLED